MAPSSTKILQGIFESVESWMFAAATLPLSRDRDRADSVSGRSDNTNDEINMEYVARRAREAEEERALSVSL